MRQDVERLTAEVSTLVYRFAGGIGPEPSVPNGLVIETTEIFTETFNNNNNGAIVNGNSNGINENNNSNHNSSDNSPLDSSITSTDNSSGTPTSNAI